MARPSNVEPAPRVTDAVVMGRWCRKVAETLNALADENERLKARIAALEP